MGTTTDTRHTRPPTEMAKEPAIADFAFSSRHPPPPYISRLSAKTAFRLVPTIVRGIVGTTVPQFPGQLFQRLSEEKSPPPLSGSTMYSLRWEEILLSVL